MTEAAQTQTPQDGVALIAASRAHSIEKGHTDVSDDVLTQGQLVIAASAYMRRMVNLWPFDPKKFHLHESEGTRGRITELAVAGGLIASEIDRLLRLAAIEDAKAAEAAKSEEKPAQS